MKYFLNSIKKIFLQKKYYICDINQINKINMFDQLLQMATGQIAEQLQGHDEVHEGNHADVVSTTGSSILETLTSQVSGGNMGGLMEMISGSQTSGDSPIVSSIASNVVSNLVQKNGLSAGAASSIAAIAIPMVMNMLNGKVQNAQSSGGLDIASIVGSLAGGGGQQSSGAGGMLGNLVSGFLGGGNNNGGGNATADIVSGLLGNLMKH
jgi:hypothetical protein